MGKTNTDDETTLSFELGTETEEFDVPGEGAKSIKKAIFNWMLKTQNLWMLTAEYADKVESVVGVGLLFKIANLKIKWQSSNSNRHPALQRPKTERARGRAFDELGRFFKTLPKN